MRLMPLLALILLGFLSSTAGAAGNHAGRHGDAVAIGQPGKAENVNRTITITMSDTMRYNPAHITARQGETIKFIVRNSGKMKHELVLGTEKELKAHYELMKKNPEMAHEEDNMVTVLPGASGEIVWHFTKAGKIDFACLLPGHYDAGMKGFVSVKAATGKKNGNATHKH